MSVAVVGAGISGLAAAYHLCEKMPATVFEASARAGGKMETVRRDGFLLEGGPDALVPSKPEAVELCRELGLQLEPMLSQRVLGLYGSRLRSLPDGLMLGVPTRLLSLAFSSILSWPGKLRVLADLWLPRASGERDESVASFIERRMGREVLDRLVAPLVTGITGADPEITSLASCFPQLRDLEQRHGSLLRGMWAQRRSGGARPPMLAPSEGMGSLAQELSRRVRVECSREVHAIERLDSGGYRLRIGADSCDVESVILATPAHASGRLLANLAPELSAELMGLRVETAATVSLGFPRSLVAHPLDSSGFVAARPSGCLCACSFVSSKLSGRCPSGQVLLRVFLRSRPGLDLAGLSSEQLIGLALDEVGPLLGIAGSPTRAWARLHPQTMPVYEVGHAARLRRIDRALEGYPGLQLIGCAYRGPGLSECVREGRLAAERVVRSAAADRTAAEVNRLRT